MPDPTPGQICYAAWRRKAPRGWLDERPLPWTHLDLGTQAAWDTAAVAVLEACASLCPICAAELDRVTAQEPPHASPDSRPALGPARAAPPRLGGGSTGGAGAARGGER